MSRNLRTVPALPCYLKPVVVDYARLQKRDFELKQQKKDNYDPRHQVHDLPPLEIGNPVCIPWMKTNATNQHECGERSLIVSTPKGQVRRKRRHLNAPPTTSKVVSNVPQSSPTLEQIAKPESSVTPTKTDGGTVTTRYGRLLRPPQRLIEE